MCFPVIVCHAVYVMLNLRVNLKAYFPIMKGETIETRLTGDVTDSDNVSPVHYCFFQVFPRKARGNWKTFKFKIKWRKCVKRERKLTLSVRRATFCHVYIVLIRSWATFGATNVLFLAASTALSKAATRAEIRYVKVINLRVISINLLVVLLELVMLFNWTLSKLPNKIGLLFLRQNG